MLKVYNIGPDWFVAKDKDAALKMALDMYGEQDARFIRVYSSDDIKLEPDDKIMKIWDDNLGIRIIKTFKEWVEDNGEGFLCSLEY